MSVPRPDYAGAVGHYTSPQRRDAIKQRWEEPRLVAVLDRLLDRIGAASRAPLDVLDVGCGSGTGLRLLDATGHVRRRVTPLGYRGLDLDEDLLAVAREEHGHDGRTSFVSGDVRDGIGDPDIDLYLSTGVPWSHLTRDELRAAVADVLAAARGRDRPVGLVVDVLGRYSIEWPTRWASTRWDYRMSFFAGDDDPPRARMSTYGGDELAEVLRAAADAADAPPLDIELVDRSLLVGRHTTTGDYAPGVPAYRTLVNALWDPEVEVDLADLRFDLELPAAPAAVHTAYAALATAWNDEVDAAARTLRSPTERAGAQAALADRLRRLEPRCDAGLGMGHSLTAVATTRPTG